MNQESQIEAVSLDAISQIRTSIVFKMRFLDMAIFRLKLQASQLQLATDGDYFYYNPVWLLKMFCRDTNLVTHNYMHVLIHCIFRHPFVNSLVDQEKWDLACDIATESIILDMNQSILSTSLDIQRSVVISSIQASVKQMTAEKIYYYFQNHSPNEAWNDLFKIDNHSLWYNRKERQEQHENSIRRDQKYNNKSSVENIENEKSSNCSDEEQNCKNKNSQDQKPTTENKQKSDGLSEEDTPHSPEPELDTTKKDQGEEDNDYSETAGSSSGETDIQSDKTSSINSSNSDEEHAEEKYDPSMSQYDLDVEWKNISEHVQMDLETFAKDQGYIVGNFEQALRAVNREKYDYDAFLKKFAVLGEVMKINDDEFDYIFYTYGLKLFKNMPLIDPLEYKDEKRIREFVIAIDTSGSTSGELVQRFLNKTYNIFLNTESFFRKINIYIIQCDAAIQEVIRITKPEEFEDYIKTMSIKGLGGTDFRPVFAYVDQLIQEKTFNNLNGLIYFTDGCGMYPEMKPQYPTAFVFIQDEFNDIAVPSWAIKMILEKESM